MQQAEQLDRYRPAPVRVWIEQTDYARINSQAQLDAALDDRIPRLPDAEQIVLDDCGHVPQVERSEQTIGLLGRFFGRVDAKAVLETERERMQSHIMREQVAGEGSGHELPSEQEAAVSR